MTLWHNYFEGNELISGFVSKKPEIKFPHGRCTLILSKGK
jgi:hypothetical protein